MGNCSFLAPCLQKSYQPFDETELKHFINENMGTQNPPITFSCQAYAYLKMK